MSAFSQRFATALPAGGGSPSPRPRRSRTADRTVSDADDPLFNGLLSALSLAAAGFWVWVVTTPLPEPALPVGADMEQLVKLLPPIVYDLPMTPPDAEPEPAATAPPRERAAPARAAREPAVAPAEPAVARARTSVLIEVLGNFGNTTTALEAVLGPDDIDEVRRAVDNVHGDRVAFAGDVVRTGDRHGGDERVVLGRPGPGGAVGTGEGGPVRVRGTIKDEPPITEVVTGGDASVIAAIVRSYRGRMDTCLEQALKGNPGLSGRVSAGWTVRGGRVFEASLVQNSTGDDALGACVLRAVRSFQFPSNLEAEVAEMPWVMDGE